jgi:hypothetical protein
MVEKIIIQCDMYIKSLYLFSEISRTELSIKV